MFGNKFGVGILKHPGYNGKGDDSPAPQPTNQTVTQTNLPKYAKPYFLDLLKRTQGLSNQEYIPYEGERIQGFTDQQLALQNQIANMATPAQFGQATQSMQGIGSLGTNAANAGLQKMLGYTPGKFNAFKVSAPGAAGAQMQAAASGFNPDVLAYQMAGPERVGAGNVGTNMFSQGAADYYMSPYIERSLAPAVREARLQGELQKQAGMLGSIGRGTFGGYRQALLQAEQERGTQRNIADIMTTGMERAYQNAQQTFQTDQARALQAQQLNQAAGLQAALANQQAGLTTGQQNLAAQMAAQQLDVGTQTQLSLANLNNEQQAQVQNLAAKLQTQGLNAQQALQAALANQQASMTAQQQGEQARQYAAGLGGQLFGQGIGAAQQAAAGIGALGSAQQQADLARFQTQQATAAQEQALKQSEMDMAYQDFLRQRDFPQEQLGFYSQILRGLPIQLASTTQTYQAPPSLGSQIAGLGLAGLGVSQLMR